MAAARMIATEEEEEEMAVEAEVTVAEVVAVATKTVPRRMTAAMMERGKTVAANGKVPVQVEPILVLQSRRKWATPT